MVPSAASAPVDLTALRAATAPVIAWYEGFLAGQPMGLGDLDVALQGLRALPPIGGRLGRAVTLVAAGGRQATTEQTIAALERLRASAGLRHPAPPPPAPATSASKPTRRRKATRRWDQPPLPGMDKP
jgi:hypothetical protein